MDGKLRSFLERYVTTKIGAEIKCCLYFFMILCFYCPYRYLTGMTNADILHMLEMTLLAYVLCWIQTLLRADLDDKDRLGRREWTFVLLSSAVHGIVGHLLGWFDGNAAVAAGFALYFVAVYFGTFIMYKGKRMIDAKFLNDDLMAFQQHLKTKEESSHV